MSIPYLVHKEDAAAYDAIRDAMECLHLEYRTALGAIPSNDPDLCARHDELEVSYAPQFEALKAQLEAKHGKPRIIGGLDRRPHDKENYYTYFRGHCWDRNSATSEMLATVPDWAVDK